MRVFNATNFARHQRSPREEVEGLFTDQSCRLLLHIYFEYLINLLDLERSQKVTLTIDETEFRMHAALTKPSNLHASPKRPRQDLKEACYPTL